MKVWLFVIALCLLRVTSDAQNIKRTPLDLERFIEELFPVQSGEVTADELFERLLLFYTNPINLNNTSREELRSLFLLSEKQINSFFQYTEAYGKLLTIVELQAIPSFNPVAIERLLPFVTVREVNFSGDNRPSLQRILAEENNFLLLRYEAVLEQKRGFRSKEDSTDSRYLGGSGKYYTRLRINHRNDFSIGFTAEKDAGEQVRWNPSKKQYGADFYSGHMQVQNKGIIKNVIVGDYQLQFGQSLLLGAAFNVGKGAETITTVRRSNIGIRPYTSVVETNYLRGAAATIEVTDNIDITGFYSGLKQDANIRSDTLESLDFISSVQQSGFHRTENELSNKNTISEQNMGGTLVYNSNNNRFSLGSTFINTTFSEQIIRPERNYNQFEFSGDHNYNIGLFGDYSWQNVNVFGEVARSKSGGYGGIIGAIANLTSKLETTIAIRNYEKDFHSFYGNAFGESSRNINESGWYWGLKYTFSRKLLVTAYFDSFKFPWLRSSINAPTDGHEYLARVTYNPTRSITIYSQVREESKADNPNADELDTPIRIPLQGVKRNYLVGIIYPANETISFKSRVQWSSYDFNNKRTEGYAIWQDINLDFGKLRFTGRFAIFDTDDFNNAQYAFENDVLFAFSVPAYSGLGTRQYLVVQYKPQKKFTIWAKFARTHFRDRNSIGSGLETIDGNQRTDIRLQVRINF